MRTKKVANVSSCNSIGSKSAGKIPRKRRTAQQRPTRLCPWKETSRCPCHVPCATGSLRKHLTNRQALISLVHGRSGLKDRLPSAHNGPIVKKISYTCVIGFFCSAFLAQLPVPARLSAARTAPLGTRPGQTGAFSAAKCGPATKARLPFAKATEATPTS